MSKKPETIFRENLVDPFLKKLKNTHAESIQQMSIGGTSDKVLCIWGRFVALELKKAGKRLKNGSIKSIKPDPLQQWKLEQVKRCGGVIITASPDNWEEVKIKLSNMDQSKENAWKQQ